MFGDVLRGLGIDSVRVLAPAVRFPGALMESVSVEEAERLTAAVAVVAMWAMTGGLDEIQVSEPEPVVVSE